MEKRMTPKQIREEKRKIAKKTLEHKVFQEVLGSNNVKTHPFMYGQLGMNGAESAYQKAMGSQDANEVRQKLYSKAKERGDNLGVYGEPSVSNYDISTDIIEQIEESKSTLSLGDLEGIVKKIAPDFKYEVPKALKDYVPIEIFQKVASEEDELTDEEKDAGLIYQQVLSQAYNRAAALQTIKSNYFSDLAQVGEQINKKYAPREDAK